MKDGISKTVSFVGLFVCLPFLPQVQDLFRVIGRSVEEGPLPWTSKFPGEDPDSLALRRHKTLRVVSQWLTLLLPSCGPGVSN